MCCGRIKKYIKDVPVYLKDYQFNKILLRYFILLFICLLLPVTVFELWYNRQIRHITQKEIMIRNEASLERRVNNVYSVLLSAKNLAYTLSNNSNVQFLSFNLDIADEVKKQENELKELLSTLMSANEYFDSIYIYLENSEKVISESGITHYDEFVDKDIFDLLSLSSSKGVSIISRSKYNYYPYLICVSYPVCVAGEGNVGQVVVNIDKEALGYYIGGGGYKIKGYKPILLIFDEDMQMLMYSDEYRFLHNNTELESLKSALGNWDDNFSRIINLWNTDFVVSGAISEEFELRCIYLTAMQELNGQYISMYATLTLMTVLMIFACFVFAVILSMWIYRPIRKTTRLLNDMSMLIGMDQNQHMDEVEVIRCSIINAKKEKDDLEEEIKERMISLHYAQICALQTQINPHFLFNTLEAIANTVALMMNGDCIATDMIYTLGKLMRISLSSESNLVPLEEELEYIILYVKLMDFRFRGRIQLINEIPESMSQDKVVKCTLQPLIENAIQHGLKNLRNDGKIWLRGEKSGVDRYLYVEDNGCGVTDEQLQELTSQLSISSITNTNHIGMRNVNQRLKLIFGEDYGLSLGHSKNGGLCVIVHFWELE